MRERIIWHLEVPKTLNKKLEQSFAKLGYATKSEFIRTAVREKLEKETKQ